MGTPENAVKGNVDKFLKELQHKYRHDIWYYKPQAGPYGTSGIPDFVIIVRGRAIFIECKAGKGRLTAIQSDQILKIRAAGAECFIYYGDPDDRDVIYRYIEGIILADKAYKEFIK